MQSQLLIFTATASIAIAQSPASAVYDWEKLAVTATKVGERRAITDRSTPTMKRFESHVTTLDAGMMPHPAHKHPDEEIVIVKEGRVEVTIEGKTQTVGAGSMFLFASNEMHGMKNAGPGRATYFVIRIATGETPAAKPTP